MLKKILAIVAMLYATVAFAAVDVNKATAAELDGIKGIGPAVSTKILDERKKGTSKTGTISLAALRASVMATLPNFLPKA